MARPEEGSLVPRSVKIQDLARCVQHDVLGNPALAPSSAMQHSLNTLCLGHVRSRLAKVLRGSEAVCFGAGLVWEVLY